MKTSSKEELLDKIKELPQESLGKISDYIDFLLYKEAKKEIYQGLDDIENGRNEELH